MGTVELGDNDAVMMKLDVKRRELDVICSKWKVVEHLCRTTPNLGSCCCALCDAPPIDSTTTTEAKKSPQEHRRLYQRRVPAVPPRRDFRHWGR